MSSIRTASELNQQLEHGLIVSCHAERYHGMDPDAFFVGMVKAVEAGEASALRVEGVEYIRLARKHTSLPIVGFVRGAYDDGSELITPTLDDVEAVFSAGADVAAIDATRRNRPGGIDGPAFFEQARARFARPLWADCSVFREGVRCAELKADYIATTLSGYTPQSAGSDLEKPDYDLIRELSTSLLTPIIAEGRIWTPPEAAFAMQCGAFAVVVGTAITRPGVITRSFAATLKETASRMPV